MSIIKLPLCFHCGVPHVPEEIAERVRNGENITIEIITQGQGIAANVLKWGTGAINVDACRVAVDPTVDDMLRTTARVKRQSETWENGSGFKNEANSLTGVSDKGRFPANIVHDGSVEVMAGFPETGKSSGGGGKKVPGTNGIYGKYKGRQYDEPLGFGDNGSAARFFAELSYDDEDLDFIHWLYTSKASKQDRNEGLEGWEKRVAGAMVGNTRANTQRLAGDGVTPVKQVFAANNHPTVKSTKLMIWLLQLVTPTGGTVLDPFAGSGSTGKAAMRAGFSFVGMEQDVGYCAIAEARIKHEYDKHYATKQIPLANTEVVQPTLFAVISS